MSFNKAEREDLKSRGLCIHCGTEPAASPHTRCKTCSEQLHKSSQERITRLIEQGLCTACGKSPPVLGQLRCQPCVDAGIARGRKRIQQLKDQGLCTKCGKIVSPPGMVRCTTCRQVSQENVAAWVARLEAKGICPACGKAPRVQGKRLCESCLQVCAKHTAEFRIERFSQGLCLCGQPLAPDRKSCEACLAKGRECEARRRSKSPAGDILKRDGFKCRLCDGSGGSRLIVHHIDGTGRSEGRRSIQANDDPSNLITLCDSCHYRIHKIVRFSLDLDLAISLIQALRSD